MGKRFSKRWTRSVLAPAPTGSQVLDVKTLFLCEGTVLRMLNVSEGTTGRDSGHNQVNLEQHLTAEQPKGSTPPRLWDQADQ